MHKSSIFLNTLIVHSAEKKKFLKNYHFCQKKLLTNAYLFGIINTTKENKTKKKKRRLKK